MLSARRLLAFEKRRAAARAISVLAPDLAFAEAKSLIEGSVRDRLLGIELLSSGKPEAHVRLFPLCADASDGVAAAAWVALLRLHPEGLNPAVPTGRSHRDAVVRMTAAHVMRRFPDNQRIEWLHRQLSDRHLEVRNVAREMLFLVAGADLGLQSAYLIQYAGLERMKDLQGFWEPDFRKSAPGG